MAIEIHCAGCSMRLRVADEHAGKQARCPKCGHVTHVSAGAVPGGPPEASDSGAALPASAPAPASSAAVAAAGGSWHLLTPEGYRYGPIGKPELDRWVADGRVTPECKLRIDGEGRWRPADELYPALRGAATSAGPYGASAGQQGGGMVAPPTPQAGHNPFADHPYPVGPGYTAYSPSRYVRPAHLAPHRGAVILVLGILGMVFGLLFLCPVLGIIAWILGSSDVREIRAGRMDPEGMGMTQAGWVLGIIATILWLVLFGLNVAVFLLFLSTGNF